MHMEKLSSSQVQITVWTYKPRSLLCSDFFMFANTEMVHVEDFFFRGKHVLTFNVPGADAMNDMDLRGLETYLFCESLRDELVSTF